MISLLSSTTKQKKEGIKGKDRLFWPQKCRPEGKPTDSKFYPEINEFCWLLKAKTQKLFPYRPRQREEKKTWHNQLHFKTPTIKRKQQEQKPWKATVFLGKTVHGFHWFFFFPWLFFMIQTSLLLACAKVASGSSRAKRNAVPRAFVKADRRT